MSAVHRCRPHRAILTAASLALAAWVHAALAADEIPAGQEFAIPALSLRAPKEELASFAAIANEDSAAGQPGAILYPGPLPVAVVAVFVHGAYESHRQAAEKSARDNLSALVLAPYLPSLSRITNSELMSRALEGLATHGDKVLIRFSEQPGPGWLIECSPKFFMTQDARALVLQNFIVIHSPDAASAATFKNTVEVVGPARHSVGADSNDTWVVDDGMVLAAASVDLLRESLSLAISDVRGDFAAQGGAYRTVRYPRGGAEKMERAQILRESPQQLILKTLHGWIMSVPVPARAAGAPDVAANP
jgi:hypothetical protein